MLALHEKSRDLSCAVIFRVIDRKFSRGQQLVPIGLVCAYIVSEHVFKDSIVFLCLSVCLGVEGSGEGILNARVCKIL